MTIQDAKQIKLADYLQSLGYTPVKQQGRSLWYKSPLRNETDASFKAILRYFLCYVGSETKYLIHNFFI